MKVDLVFLLRYPGRVPTPHEELRARIAELQSMNLDALQARVTLLNERVNLEELADTIADATDTDPQVVLLVVQTTWGVRIDAELGDPQQEVTPADFRDAVEADVRAILHALAAGETEVCEPVRNAALKRTIALGKQGVKITPTKETFSAFAEMISKSPL